MPRQADLIVIPFTDRVNIIYYMGSGGRAVERPTVNRGDGGSILPTAVSKLYPTFACVFRKRH